MFLWALPVGNLAAVGFRPGDPPHYSIGGSDSTRACVSDVT